MIERRSISPPNRREKLTLRLLIVTGIGSCLYFCYWFLREDYVGHPLLYGLLAAILAYNIVKRLNLWYHYFSISVPETPTLQGSPTVDILTTFYPGEPYEMIEATLVAIQQITYPHTTYLCDEANDPYLIEVCRRLEVIHVTRDNRINAKAGNINNALRQATGEICLILDPDHRPYPDFLDFVVPHFQDPKIGFVQVVQSYYNKFESLVAKGAAQQTFHFYGPMMMSMNTYGSVNAIGANCTFRRAALDDIGGHAPGLAEDMHTAMLLYEKGWQSVYVPKVLARGLVPTTLDAYYKQQLKWARGTFALLFGVYPRIFRSITNRQRIHYAWSFLHYLAGFSYLLGFLLPILSLFLADTPWRGEFLFFILIYAPLLFSSLIIRYYVQKWLIEENERGFHIIGGLLELVTWWVFVLGTLYSLLRKKVPYLPTPKDDKGSLHPSLLLPNFALAGLSLAAIAYGLTKDFSPFSLVMAGFCLLNAFLLSFSGFMAINSTNRIGNFRRGMNTHLRRLLRLVKQTLLRALDLVTVFVRGFPILIAAIAITVPIWLINVREAALWETNEGARAPVALFTGVEEDSVKTAIAGQLQSVETFDSLRVTAVKAALSNTLESRRQQKDLRKFPVQSLRAVGYQKVEDWWESHYPLSRKPLLHDFNTIADLGFNALVTRPPGIFRHNVFLLAETVDLGVLIQLPAPTVREFLRDTAAQSKVRVSTLEVVADYQEEERLWGYVIDLTELPTYGPPPGPRELDSLTATSLNWLEKTLQQIKVTDPRHPILLNLPVWIIDKPEFWTEQLPRLPTDALGLIISTTPDLEKARVFGLTEQPLLTLSQLPSDLLPQLGEDLSQQPLLVKNLQNNWRSSTVSFDGLLDFSGRRKDSTCPLITTCSFATAIPEPRIILPASPLYPGAPHRYNAVLRREHTWSYGKQAPEFRYEWMLVKKSATGNQLALKMLASGPELLLETPPDYHHYELRLTVTDGVTSRSVRSALNTPLSEWQMDNE